MQGEASGSPNRAKSKDKKGATDLAGSTPARSTSPAKKSSKSTGSPSKSRKNSYKKHQSNQYEVTEAPTSPARSSGAAKMIRDSQNDGRNFTIQLLERDPPDGAGQNKSAVSSDPHVDIEDPVKQPPVEGDEEDDSTVINDLTHEIDPVKRHLQQLKLKQKQAEKLRRKPLPRLSYEQRGWNAPLDESYVPVGRMTEILGALEQVRQQLPHTRERFQKQTYRQMLIMKKRERDQIDKQRKMRSASNKARNPVQISLSASSMEEILLEDVSRVVAKILPQEQATLVQIRNYAHEQKMQELASRGQTVQPPRLNKFGRLAAGYVTKVNERRDEIERKRKLNEANQRLSQRSKPPTLQRDVKLAEEAKAGNSKIEQLTNPNGSLESPKDDPVFDQRFGAQWAQQMEKEKSRQWIRKRNARIYDEKIKNLITTTDNGSALLKQEIEESEGRLAAIKLGRTINEVIPKHHDEFFLNDKESYFLGDKRNQLRFELQQQHKEKTQTTVRPEVAEIEPHFQTFFSNDVPEKEEGGFFLTEQPYVEQTKAKGNDEALSEYTDMNAVVNVSAMFAQAKDRIFEKVFRATTDAVKGMFLNRVKSRESHIRSDRTKARPTTQGALHQSQRYHHHHQQSRALSHSTAAATSHVGYKTDFRNSHKNSEVTSIAVNQQESGLCLSPKDDIRRSKHLRRCSMPLMKTGAGERVVGTKAQNITISTVDVDESVTRMKQQLFEGTTSQNVNSPPQQSSKTPRSRSTLNFANAKRLLQDAQSKRAFHMTKLLQAEVHKKHNRVRYLQNLQKERIAKKKIEQAKGQKLFEGFSKEEMEEILVEMPQLKKIQKEKQKLIAEGPEPPQFSMMHLIHLDSLHDIANRDKAELRKRVIEQIDNRKRRISQHVSEIDKHYGLQDLASQAGAQKSTMSKANAAILKKFQQSNKDGFDDELEPNFNFHNCLKQRLNLADARQQQKLYETFKNEDFAARLWEERGSHVVHAAQSSERAQEKLNASMKQIGRRSTLRSEQMSSLFIEHMSSVQQAGSSLSAGTLKRQQARSSPTFLDSEQQRKVDEELKDFDHSDQVILVKLVEIYEQRLSSGHAIADVRARVKKNEKQSSTSTLSNNESLQAVFNIETDRKNVVSVQDTADGAQKNHKQTGVETQLDRRVSLKTQNGAGVRERTHSQRRMTLAPPSQNKNVNQSRSATHVNNAMPVVQSFNTREKRKINQVKKDYRKFAIEYLTKEYQRAFDAIVGCSDADMEQVIDSFNAKTFYREARDFLVGKGKFMTDGHLIHLKEDPKTILSMYRIFMLQFKSAQMSMIGKKVVQKKKAQPMQARANSNLSLNEVEESDYSESDFPDLMSNKQIEENIRVFFDRIHELVNPIDEQRLKLDSVQQIKATVKTFYKKKAAVAEKLLKELDQMRAERPSIVRVKADQFNDPELHNQSNLRVEGGFQSVPTQQVNTRMADVRLNAELFRLRRFKMVAKSTAKWYNQLAAKILAEHLQDQPLVIYMLEQIQNVIEMGELFTRAKFAKLMSTFNAFDSAKHEVVRMHGFLDELLPRDEQELSNSKGTKQAQLLSTMQHEDAISLAKIQAEYATAEQANNQQSFRQRSFRRPPKHPLSSSQTSKQLTKVTFTKNNYQ